MAMAKSNVQPEIWSHVFSFLLRDCPPPASTTHWYDLHQGDLAQILRVNTTFYEVAAHHLYDKCVVSNVKSFFLGFDDMDLSSMFGGLFHGYAPTTPAYRSEKRTSKRQLLTRVKQLHLVHAGFEVQPSYVQLLKHGRWDEIGRSKAEQTDSAKEEVRNAMEAAKILDRLPINPLPNLVSISLAAFGDKGWTAVFAGNPITTGASHLPDEFMSNHDLGASLCEGTTPKHWCQHLNFGPLSLYPALVTHLPHRVETFTSHKDQNLDSTPIISGAINRIIYSPKIAHCMFCNHAPGLIRQIAQDINRQTTHWLRFPNVLPKLDRDHTTLELYGPLRTDCAAGIMKDVGVDTSKPKQVKEFWSRMRKVDDMRLKDMQAVLNAELMDEWKGLVFLKRRENAPACPACGLDESTIHGMACGEHAQ